MFVKYSLRVRIFQMKRASSVTFTPPALTYVSHEKSAKKKGGYHPKPSRAALDQIHLKPPYKLKNTFPKNAPRLLFHRSPGRFTKHELSLKTRLLYSRLG
jgi:hypothetical protein